MKIPYSIIIVIFVAKNMTTTIQVLEKTLQMLNKLKEEMQAKSNDEVIKTLIFERKKIPRSMFGSNPKLNPFSHEDEAELHN